MGKGKITRQSAEVALSHLSVVESLPALADCDVVIEAIVEDLGIKQALFADLEAIVDRECILATNTSSLSVTSIAADLNCRDRVAGFHFFNPVPLMKVIEVVGASILMKLSSTRCLSWQPDSAILACVPKTPWLHRQPRGTCLQHRRFENS